MEPVLESSVNGLVNDIGMMPCFVFTPLWLSRTAPCAAGAQRVTAERPGFCVHRGQAACGRHGRALRVRMSVDAKEQDEKVQQAAPANSNDIYSKFWEHADATMKQRLGSELKDYPIPEGFEWKEAITGKGQRTQWVTTKSYAYQTPKLRQIRAAHVQGGKALQVLNYVIFPHMNYDVPFFGADLVTLPGGHLIALDMQPLFHTDEYREKYSKPLMETFQKYKAQLEWGGDFPEEAAQYFSPCFLWTRPGDNETVDTVVFDAFKDYLNIYLDIVQNAPKITDPVELDKIRERQISYLKYRAEKDPARGMFLRFYGEQWTEEYIHGFLFDLEEKMAKGEYTLPV
ncbi:Phycoerythrobilin:ferredoxin oxidoreductase [Porphyridium purpureum]|uniref:Phycoerythrobilin:ferredoxin oxidoreductase n=1 Tax=Porphyridium purpureum TaxID=35688 RepID=A0A5J4YPV5_PORPP|nr:Phycoerythrobilin:ferredoxin oxidoreductase [Porphyridium purpureum]|eukprot:POR5451..scf222_8